MLKAAAKNVMAMNIATKKDPECVRVVVRSAGRPSDLTPPLPPSDPLSQSAVFPTHTAARRTERRWAPLHVRRPCC